MVCCIIEWLGYNVLPDRLPVLASARTAPTHPNISHLSDPLQQNTAATAKIDHKFATNTISYSRSPLKSKHVEERKTTSQKMATPDVAASMVAAAPSAHVKSPMDAYADPRHPALRGCLRRLARARGRLGVWDKTGSPWSAKLQNKLEGTFVPDTQGLGNAKSKSVAIFNNTIKIQYVKISSSFCFC